MLNHDLNRKLVLKKDFVLDPPDELLKHFEFKDLARLAVIQLKAEHAILKVQEEVMEEAMEIYSGYLK